MRRVGRLNGLPVMWGGDDNVVRKDWIMYSDDNGSIQLRKRADDNSIKSVTGSNDDTKYLYFMVKSWTAKFSNTDKSLLDIVEFLPIVSSQRVNFFLYSGIYTPPEVFTYSNGESVRRYDYVKAIRIPRCRMFISDDETITISSLKDIEKALAILGLNLDLEEMLSPISKEEFDSLEIPTLPFM